jgi:hypothetical protein
VLSPDGYTILPMRPITTARTIVIFMMGKLDRNLHVVNAGRRKRGARSPPRSWGGAFHFVNWSSGFSVSHWRG